MTKSNTRPAGFKLCPISSAQCRYANKSKRSKPTQMPKIATPASRIERHARESNGSFPSESSIRTTTRNPMTQRKKKKRQSSKPKSSTSFVHHPQAGSHKAVSQVTTRAAIIQRRRSCDIESELGSHRQQHIRRDDYKARPRHDGISTYPEQIQVPGSRG